MMAAATLSPTTRFSKARSGVSGVALSSVRTSGNAIASDLDTCVGVGSDAGSDVGPDAGSDVGPDAGSDVGPDAGSDVGPDAGVVWRVVPVPGADQGPVPSALVARTCTW